MALLRHHYALRRRLGVFDIAITNDRRSIGMQISLASSRFFGAGCQFEMWILAITF
jgi:hypothetical protein